MTTTPDGNDETAELLQNLILGEQSNSSDRGAKPDSASTSDFLDDQYGLLPQTPIYRESPTVAPASKVLPVDEESIGINVESIDTTPKVGYAARAVNAGKHVFKSARNYVGANPRKGLAIGLGHVAALAIGIPIAMNAPAETRDRLMYGYPVSYTEGKGLSDDNTMEVVDGDMVYRYLDTDGAALDLSGKREPARFDPRTLEEITVIYQGRTERFVREDGDAPEMFTAHNRVYNGALKNIVSEHYEPENKRREYLIKRAGNLADVFDPQPKQERQPIGPSAE